MHRKYLTIGVAIAALTIAATAQASVKNSIQPGKLVFGNVVSGQHPNRVVTLHNGTGQPRRIKTIGVAGAGGYVFTLPLNTAMLASSGLPRCVVGMVLPAGARCALDVRVHTTRVGWFRSVLRVVYRNGWMNSGQLEAHVVAS
jgi:hypothetical protein